MVRQTLPPGIASKACSEYLIMCGICGVVDVAGVASETIERMMQAIEHRGPDDAGMMVDTAVGLGHRRLSIIDVDGGHQPISDASGRFTIVFNGEIYNYRSLRESLREKDSLRTESDTEVLLQLYKEQGASCVDLLRGMFAFAIWDSETRSLFMARDHLGQKPLFYAQVGERLMFASEIKSLLAGDDSLRVLNVASLHQYLSLRIIAPPNSMFAGISKLPPGHHLTFRPESGTISIERFWQLHYEPKDARNEDALLDEIDDAFEEAVRLHMVSDVKVGAFLSGGLDSGLVVAMMNKVAGPGFDTFSVGVPYRKFSELPAAALTAEQYGTHHHAADLEMSLLDVLPDIVWYLDEPSDPLSSTMYYISGLASQHVKVVLGGDGGDEMFGGYDRYYGNRYLDYYALLPQPLRREVITRLLRLLPGGSWYKSPIHKLNWLNQLSFADKGGDRYAESLSYFYFNGVFRDRVYGPRLQEAERQFDALAIIRDIYETDNAREIVDRMLHADTRVRLPAHSVMILDRMSMAHGLEARSPFMDHKLVELVARYPVSVKVRGSRLRYLQSRLAERYLRPEILQRPKQGFSSALPYLLAGEFRTLFDRLLHDAHLVRDGYLLADGIEHMLTEHLAGQHDHGNRLWLLCNAEIWYRMLIEGKSREAMRSLLRVS